MNNHNNNQRVEEDQKKKLFLYRDNDVNYLSDVLTYDTDAMNIIKQNMKKIWNEDWKSKSNVVFDNKLPIKLWNK